MYKIIQNWTIDADSKAKNDSHKRSHGLFFICQVRVHKFCLHIRDNIFFICLNEKGTAFINMNSICNIYKSN